MAKNIYVGINDVARKVSSAYVGVNGVARKITKGYVGVNGIAQQFYTSQPPYTILNYLESSGTQYIDTGITPQYNTSKPTKRNRVRDKTCKFRFGWLKIFVWFKSWLQSKLVHFILSNRKRK